MILPIKSDIGMCMCPCPLVSIKVTLTKVELLLYITYYHTSTDSTHVYTHTYPRTCMYDFFVTQRTTVTKIYHPYQLLDLKE